MVTGFRDLLKTLEKHKWVSLCGEAPAQARIRTVPTRGCKTLPGWLKLLPAPSPPWCTLRVRTTELLLQMPSLPKCPKLVITAHGKERLV